MVTVLPVPAFRSPKVAVRARFTASPETMPEALVLTVTVAAVVPSYTRLTPVNTGVMPLGVMLADTVAVVFSSV